MESTDGYRTWDGLGDIAITWTAPSCKSLSKAGKFLLHNDKRSEGIYKQARTQSSWFVLGSARERADLCLLCVTGMSARLTMRQLCIIMVTTPHLVATFM